jgi:hypothetical protein
VKFDPWRTYRAFRRSGSSPLLPIAAAAAMEERKRISALPASGSFALALSRETLDVINGSLVLRLYDRACCIFVSDGLSALIEPQALQRRVGRTGKLRIFPREPFWFAPQRKYCGGTLGIAVRVCRSHGRPFLPHTPAGRRFTKQLKTRKTRQYVSLLLPTRAAARAHRLGYEPRGRGFESCRARQIST